MTRSILQRTSGYFPKRFYSAKMAESASSSLHSNVSGSHTVTVRGFGGVLELLEDRRLQIVAATLPSCTLCGVLQPVSFILPCSHVFCTACFVQAYKNGFCPVDDSDITEADVRSNRVDERLLLDLKVKCTNCVHGCKFDGKAEDVLHHVKNDCPYRHVVCARCNQDVLQAMMVQHYARCREVSEDVTKSHSVLPDEDQQQKLSRFLSDQTFLRDTVSALIADVQKNDANKLKRLEATLDSLNQDLSRIKYEVEAAQNKLLERTEQLHRKVDRLIQDGKQTISDVAYFNVEDFAAFKAEARDKGFATRKSDSFVIGGYTGKIRVDLKVDNVSTYFGLYFILCKSNRDAMLEWPFKRPYLFTLVHPLYKNKNIEFTVCPYQRPDAVPECYMRPRRSETVGFGNDKFSTVEVVERNGFVCGDAVCARLELL